MKGFYYYVCPKCGSVSTSSSSVSLSCCGSVLEPVVLKQADGENALPIRRDGDEIIITISHPMRKDDYITFIALESYDGLILRKLYPEWNEDVAIAMKKGRLVWSSSSGEAYYQKISF